jgi:endoglucanase
MVPVIKKRAQRTCGGMANRLRRQLLLALGSAPTAALAAAMTPIRPGTAPERSLLSSLWPGFRRRFLTADGRVLDDDGSTHSEALGSALLGAAAAGDHNAFERVWAFAQQLRRDDGLFSWRSQRGGRVIDVNNATDGDLYIAWALLRGARAFDTPGYAMAARSVARAVRAHCVRESPHGPVLVPGRAGFERANMVVANPSYWVFPAFAELDQVDAHPLWAALERTALTLLARSRFGRFGLAPDWLEIAQEVRPWRERPARFGYEAIRVPLFLYWGGHVSHPQLTAFADYAHAADFPAWTALDSDEQAAERAPAGFEAIARLARSVPERVRITAPRLSFNYYPSSLSLMAAMANDDVVANGGAERSAENHLR